MYALRSRGNVDAEGYLSAQHHPYQDMSLGVGDMTPPDPLVGAGVGRPPSPRRRSLGEEDNVFVFRTAFVPKSNIYEVFQQCFLMVIDVSLQSRSVHQLGHARSSPLYSSLK